MSFDGRLLSILKEMAVELFLPVELREMVG